jgi:hypothetical protein
MVDLNASVPRLKRKAVVVAEAIEEVLQFVLAVQGRRKLFDEKDVAFGNAVGIDLGKLANGAERLGKFEGDVGGEGDHHEVIPGGDELQSGGLRNKELFQRNGVCPAAITRDEKA